MQTSFPIARQYSCLFVVFFPRGHNWKRSFLWKGLLKNASAIKKKICYTAAWWEKNEIKCCAKIVPPLNRKLYFKRQNITVWSFAFLLRPFYWIAKLFCYYSLLFSAGQNPPHLLSTALHPVRSSTSASSSSSWRLSTSSFVSASSAERPYRKIFPMGGSQCANFYGYGQITDREIRLFYLPF